MRINLVSKFGSWLARVFRSAKDECSYTEHDIRRQAVQQSARIIRAIPEDLDREAKHFRDMVVGSAGDPTRQLLDLYRIMDRVYAHVAPLTPCKNGCSSCCHIQVAVTDLEARIIGNHIHRTPKKPVLPIAADSGTYSEATPCTFLGKDGGCTIYPVRPFACRRHLSFMRTNSLCQFPYWDVELPNWTYLPVSESFQSIRLSRNAVVADIRSYFPSRMTDTN